MENENSQASVRPILIGPIAALVSVVLLGVTGLVRGLWLFAAAIVIGVIAGMLTRKYIDSQPSVE